jgi:hypothetical protein
VTSTTVRRRQLYEQVWTTPMRVLARSYGMSDVGLAKICRAHDIPLPPRGYWAKKAVGKAGPQATLPNPENDPALEIRRTPYVPPLAKPRAIATDAAGMSHPLIRRTRELLTAAGETPSWRRLVEPVPGSLNVRVSRNMLPRGATPDGIVDRDSGASRRERSGRDSDLGGILLRSVRDSCDS